MENVKYIGASRRFDDLGRIGIWKEIRKMLEIHEGDPCVMGVTKEGYIVLAKYTDEGGEGWKNVDI